MPSETRRLQSTSYVPKGSTGLISLAVGFVDAVNEQVPNCSGQEVPTRQSVSTTSGQVFYRASVSEVCAVVSLHLLRMSRLRFSAVTAGRGNLGLLRWCQCQLNGSVKSISEHGLETVEVFVSAMMATFHSMAWFETRGRLMLSPPAHPFP